MVAVKAGDRIALHYALRNSQGEVVATSSGGATLEFEAAGAEVIAGLSMGVIGMQVGERRTLQLQPVDAFGSATVAVERTIASDRLPGGVQLDDVLRIEIAGMSALVWVVGVEADCYRVSTQHPLAGHTLQLEIQLLALDPR